jgi:hypothetical protein
MKPQIGRQKRPGRGVLKQNRFCDSGFSFFPAS